MAAALTLSPQRPAVEANHVEPFSYTDQAFLAPMVRVCTLPFRLLASEAVYSEEIVDKKLMACTVRENEKLDTVDFISKDGTVCFQTPRKRKERVCLQLGTADAGWALKAANVVAKYVSSIDVNMGCPVHFSVQGGMGSALLTQPEKVKDILSTLVRNLDIPVTCKIRLLDHPRHTLDLCKLIESCGVAAMGVHARGVPDKPNKDPARPEEVRPIVEALSIPIIYNGDVFTHESIGRLKTLTGASSVMIGRGALWNASVFRSEGPLPLYDVASRYLDICQQYENAFSNSKYVLMEMLKVFISKSRGFQQITTAKTYSELSAALKLTEQDSVMTSPYRIPQQFTSAQWTHVLSRKRKLESGVDGDGNEEKDEKEKQKKAAKSDEKRDVVPDDSTGDS